MGGKKSKRPIRLAHELSRKRKVEISKALKEYESESRPDWDRDADWGDIRFYRRRIKPGTMRTIEFPLLNLSLGDEWPIPVTIIHGARPGPTVTILGGIHGDELTGPSACTNLLSNVFTDEKGALDPKTMAGTVRILSLIHI